MQHNIRLQKIMNIINRDNVVDVSELANIFGVSEKTIRLDLNELENVGLLQRIHGGAIKPNNSERSISSGLRTEHLAEKRAIAKKALAFIKENDVILLDAGSTTYELAKLLGDFPVAVIANDIYIINELAFKKNVTLYITGGMVENVGDQRTIIGDDAYNFLKKYHTNKSFISTSAIDYENGTSINYYGNLQTKRGFVEEGENIFCLVDSSKFGKRGFSKVADINMIQNVITDRGLSESEANKYRNKGVNIIYAD